MGSNGKKLVLFLCTANSCRSQMAEGWANHLKSDELIAFSAGVRPSPVNERAIEAMAEAGVDISGHYSKHIDDLAGVDFDYVIAVCDNAAENCPVFPGKAKVIRYSFDDPAAAIGTIEQIKDKFRQVRDQIRDYVMTLPEALGESNGQQTT